jgi:hypothetical protein
MIGTTAFLLGLVSVMSSIAVSQKSASGAMTKARPVRKPERLPDGIYGPIRPKPLVLQDGKILSGSSTEDERSWNVWIERSPDNGRTWKGIGPITVPQYLAPDTPSSSQDEPYGIIQPCIVSLGGAICGFAPFQARTLAGFASPIQLTMAKRGVRRNPLICRTPTRALMLFLFRIQRSSQS